MLDIVFDEQAGCDREKVRNGRRRNRGVQDHAIERHPRMFGPNCGCPATPIDTPELGGRNRRFQRSASMTHCCFASLPHRRILDVEPVDHDAVGIIRSRVARTLEAEDLHLVAGSAQRREDRRIGDLEPVTAVPAGTSEVMKASRMAPEAVIGFARAVKFFQRFILNGKPAASRGAMS